MLCQHGPEAPTWRPPTPSSVTFVCPCAPQPPLFAHAPQGGGSPHSLKPALSLLAPSLPHAVTFVCPWWVLKRWTSWMMRLEVSLR